MPRFGATSLPIEPKRGIERGRLNPLRCTRARDATPEGAAENPSMTLAVVHSRALRGLEAPAVTVEVHLANGLPSFTLVGLADTEVKEARERVRAALQTSGLEFPHNKRVTVSLAPADLPKESGRFDLPIALGILAAAGHLDAARLDAYEFAGELSLGGQLRPVHGALAMALALQRTSSRDRPHARPAAGQRRRIGARRRALGARRRSPARRRARPSRRRGRRRDRLARTTAAGARRAPRRGTTSSTCAARRRQARPRGRRGGPAQSADGRSARHRQVDAGAPPRRAPAAAVARRSARVGSHPERRRRLQRRPLGRARAARAAPLGVVSGAGRRRLAAPTRRGVARPPRRTLSRRAARVPARRLEALREPLETGRIVISRAARQADFPARFQLVAAMNPCPCGQLGNPPRALPLHARRGAALPGPHQRPAARPHRPAGRGAGGRRHELAGARRRRGERGRRARVARRAARRSSARASPTRARRRRARPALPPRCRELTLPAGADDAPRLVGARFHRVLRVARTVADLAAAARSQRRTSAKRSSTGARSAPALSGAGAAGVLR